MRLSSALAALTLFSACTPTTAVIDLALADGAPAVGALEIAVFDPHRLLKRQEATAPKLPGSVWIRLPDATETVRVALVGQPPGGGAGASGVVRAALSIPVTPHAEWRGSAVLSPSTPDGDGDGVPDTIDNCATTANADQASDDGVRGNLCGGAQSDLPSPTMLLAAVHPEIAEAGDLVTVEGRFAAGATVLFPGSTQAVAPSTISGTGRLQVAVPADATVGDLVVVAADGGRSNALPFRRTSYALEVQPFSSAYPQTATARAMPLPADLHDRLLTVGDRLCVLGSRYSGRAECAKLHRDGTAGPFAPATRIDPGFDGMAVIQLGSTVYLLGGRRFGPEEIVSDAVRAVAVEADGSLAETFTTVGTMTRGRAWHEVVVLGSWLYVVGGESATGPDGSFERAEIRADGTLGRFELVTGVALQKARSSFLLAVVGPWLYVLGGYDGSSQTTSVERVRIGDDGALGRVEAALLPDGWTSGRATAATISVGRWVYALGGFRGGVAYDDLWRARTDAASGELLPIEAVSPRLYTDEGAARAAIAGDRVYVLGVETQRLQVASLRRPGSGVAFAAPPGAPTLRQARAEAALIVLGDALYLAGGRDQAGAPLASIERAPIAVDGTVGAFADAGALRTPRVGAALVEHGRFVYVVGGTTDGSVERIPLLGGRTPSLPSEAVDTATLQTPRRGASAVVLRATDGSAALWVVGGLDMNGAPVATVERAPLADDGSMGAFVTQPTTGPGALVLAEGRARHAAALVGHNDGTSYALRYYVLGGRGAGGAISSIEYSTLGAPFASAGALTTPRDGAGAWLSGHTLTLVGGGAAQAATSESARVRAQAALDPFAAGALLPSTRAGASVVDVGNWVWLFGGDEGAGATTTILRAPLP